MKFIGDIHGDYNTYLDIISDGKASIQLGDMGFDYSPIYHIDSQHKFIGGNHENYDVLKYNPPASYLGDFGIYNEIGYVRGAYSIDKSSRLIGYDWWPNEELNYEEVNHCLDYFSSHKPNIMVSHDCPQFVVNTLYGLESSNTRNLLSIIHSMVQPKIWIFGHHHRTIDVTMNGTRFICVDINKHVEI